MPKLLWSRRPTPPAPVGASRTAVAEARPVSPERRRRWLRRVLLLLGPALVLIVAGYFYVTGGRYVDTDDAYVRADMVAISAEVSGPIVQVDVRENQHVDPGQVLFRLDQQPFQIALAQAEARLEKADNDVRALKASYRQKQQELELANKNVAYAEQEFQRQAKLAKRDFASQAKYDEAQHNLEVAHQQVAVTEQELRGLLADLAAIRTSRSSSIRATSRPRRRATRRRSTCATRPSPPRSRASPARSPQLGDYVSAGTPVFSLVADQDRLGRGQLQGDRSHPRAGRPAGDRHRRHLSRPRMARPRSRASARHRRASSRCCRPQNATGNWVKVVQRIPVRLAIDDPARDPPLRAGMSVDVEIDTGYRRELPARRDRARLGELRPAGERPGAGSR